MPHIFSIGINAEDGSRGAAVVAGGGIGIVIGSHYEYLSQEVSYPKVEW